MLNNLIPSQAFELIRDAIGRVLTAEFANQMTLGAAIILPNIYLERTCPIDKEELPVINVIYAESQNYDENTSYTSIFDNKFLIEVYTNSPTTPSTDGDKKSALANVKLMGMIRSILMDHKNLYLDFTDKFIQSRKVQSIARTQPRISNDAENTISGTLEVHYVAEETTETEQGTLGILFNTVVKLENTEKGYKFTII